MKNRNALTFKITRSSNTHVRHFRVHSTSMDIYILISPIDRWSVFLLLHLIVARIRHFSRLTRYSKIVIVYSLDNKARGCFCGSFHFTFAVLFHPYHTRSIVFFKGFNRTCKITEIQMSIFEITKTCTALVRSKTTCGNNLEDLFYHTFKACPWNCRIILATIKFKWCILVLFRRTTNK